MKTNKKHFVLVHGSCHGAWCWYKLVPLLKLAGLQVTPLDLGASGINTKQIEGLSFFSDYIQPLFEFMASLPQEEKVILVGHSYGGLALSLAMENFPEKILVAVFVTAYLPNSIDPPATLVQEFFKRTPAESLLDCQLNFQEGQENLLISAIFGPKYLESMMYHNCQPEDLELAKMVIRPFKFFLEDLAKESLLSEAKYGSIKRVFVLCKEDRVMKEEFVQWMIENSPADEVKIIDGADHMVMLSKTQELCKIFQEIAVKYQRCN
ncbi:methylesterase 10 [Jatropha curcas]|uniref:methylesterase 10 n=1 Tax=Jatropha curcas TaxID=180498 RepID=UPI0005FBC2AA|nr:methylesterase 10 [Jatropha curcas]